MLLAVLKQEKVTSSAAYDLVNSVFKQFMKKLKPLLAIDEHEEGK